MADWWMVDSSAWIFALRPKPFPPIRDRIDYLLAEGRILITGMIELELLAGAPTRKELIHLRELLAGLENVNVRPSDWASAAEMGFELRRKAITVPSTDVLIAHQARLAGAGILHADRDFTLISKHFRIEQEDYSSAVAG